MSVFEKFSLKKLWMWISIRLKCGSDVVPTASGFRLQVGDGDMDAASLSRLLPAAPPSDRLRR